MHTIKEVKEAIRREFVMSLKDERNYTGLSLTPDWDIIFVVVYQKLAKRGFDINKHEMLILEEFEKLQNVLADLR